MTRFEECFPPHIVQTVYRRMKLKTDALVNNLTQIPADNVVNLSAYRQRIDQNRPIEVL